MKHSLNKFLAFGIVILFILHSCDPNNNKQELSLKWSPEITGILSDTASIKREFDSIKKLVPLSGSDTAAIMFINQLASVANGTLNKILAEEAIDQSKKVNYKRGEFIGTCWLSVFYGRNSEFKKADSILNEIEKPIREAKYLDALVLNLRWRATMHRFLSIDSLAMHEYHEALALSLQYNYKTDLAFIYPNMGMLYFPLSKLDSVKYFMEEGLKYAIKDNNRMMTSFCYINLGRVYESRNDFNTSLELVLKASGIAEANKDKPRIAEIYSSIASLYGLNNEVKKAYEYYDKSIAVAKEIKDEFRVCYCYLAISEEKKAEGKNEEALKYVNDAFDLAVSLEFPDYLASAYYVRGEVFRNMKKFDEALHNFDSAIAIGEELQDNQIIHNGVIGKSMAYYDMGNFAKGKVLAEQAYKTAVKDDLANRIKDASEVIYRSSERLGDYKTAFQSYRNFVIMKDSMNNLEQTKKFAGIEYKSKEDNLKAEQLIKNKLHETEQEKKEQEIKQQKFVRNLFIGGSVVLIGLLIIIFRSLQQNRRKNKIISEQKEKAELQNILIEKQKHEVEEKQKELLDSIHYAKRIQRALITSEKYIQNSLIRMRPKE
jgi:tetratricopeptide (TPR) repeat protein